MNILYRRELAEAEGGAEAKRKELVADYEEHLANPHIAAARGYVDSLIAPVVHAGLRDQDGAVLRNKRQSCLQEARQHSRVTCAQGLPAGATRDMNGSELTAPGRSCDMG